MVHQQLLNLISPEKSSFFKCINLKKLMRGFLTSITKIFDHYYTNVKMQSLTIQAYSGASIMSVNSTKNKEKSQIKSQINGTFCDIHSYLNDEYNNNDVLASISLNVRKLYRKLYYQNIKIRHLEQENQKLKELAFLDDLTQLANRRKFYLYLNNSLQCKQRQPIALILVDIDFFKPYNDTYGHLSGDLCLQRIASAIQGAITACHSPKPYLAARYGGEEFAVILPGMGLEDGINVAEQIRLNVLAQKIPHCGSEINSFITLSAGVSSQIVGDELLSSEQLILEADKALYQAKNKGRDRVCFNS